MKTSYKKRLYEGKDLESMSTATNYYNWIIDEFSEYVHGCVLEVGAGSGNFSEYILRKKPKKFYALEPTKQMVKELEKKLAGEKNVLIINDFLSGKHQDIKDRVDTAFYINVLEHVEDDKAELKLIFDKLKPGGNLCIYVPALPSLHGGFDEKVGHYRRYTKGDIEHKLRDSGFEICRINYSDIFGIIPWFIKYKIFRSSSLGSGSVTAYDKLVIPVVRFQEQYIKPPIGKNLWVTARKPK